MCAHISPGVQLVQRYQVPFPEGHSSPSPPSWPGLPSLCLLLPHFLSLQVSPASSALQLEEGHSLIDLPFSEASLCFLCSLPCASCLPFISLSVIQIFLASSALELTLQGCLDPPLPLEYLPDLQVSARYTHFTPASKPLVHPLCTCK